MDFELYPLGDGAAVVRFGDMISEDIHASVLRFAALLEREPFKGLVETVVAYTTVTVFYDVWKVWNSALDGYGKKDGGRSGTVLSPYEIVKKELLKRLHSLDSNGTGTGDVISVEKIASIAARLVHIPVCYEGDYGPDLEEVAHFHSISKDKVIELHTFGEYLVYMIGFAPGFAYLGGLSDRLATPRRSVPRLQIQAGSVGIGGNQTGVYPLSTPGGWHIIGRTPLQLFRPWQEPPVLLSAGDRVQFYPISSKEFEGLTREAGHGS